MPAAAKKKTKKRPPSSKRTPRTRKPKNVVSSKRALAKALKRGERTIDRWILDGMPRKEKAAGLWEYDVDQITKWRAVEDKEARERQRESVKKNGDEQPAGIAELDLRIKKEQAEKLRLNNEILRANYHDRIQCETNAVRKWNQVLDFIRMLPDRLATDLGSLTGTDSAIIEKYLDEELVAAICHEFSTPEETELATGTND